MRLLYICLGFLLAPVMLGVILWKGVRNRGWWRHVGERFGLGAPVRAGGIWVHAVSVGEVQSSASLVRALLQARPDLPVTVTTFTPAGRERALALLGDTVAHRYVPFDLAGVVGLFFARTRPRLAVIVETELWPNLFHGCGRRGIPLVLASARVSPRSIPRYRWLARLFRETLSHGIVIGAQSEGDAARFRSIGANPARTHVLGNLKFDYVLPPDVPARAASLREALGRARPVWVAGSTHEGEEEIVLDAHRRVRERHPDALLVLVPRKPQRLDYVVALLRRRGHAFVTRTSGAPVTPAVEVLLVDTLGELVLFYGAADVAFVGGSLVPVGGHNLLEPAALGKPMLTGPHNFNAEGIADLFVEVGAAHVVIDAPSLAMLVTDYLGDAPRRERDGRAGYAAQEANRGTLARLVALIEPLLPVLSAPARRR
ncbi:MAG: lipid IV(A) 3-deoxy-D-manno-octulosonic acid transferase [Pseudomonadota bacterium]